MSNYKEKQGNNIKKLNFEQAMVELEKVVAQLENEKIDLDKSIDLYERGEFLKQHCEELLQNAELRIRNINVQIQDDTKNDIKN